MFAVNYDVRANYIHKAELGWMISGNIIYYCFAIPMAFYFKDKRAFCKVACPVSLVMKVPTKFALIRKGRLELNVWNAEFVMKFVRWASM